MVAGLGVAAGSYRLDLANRISVSEQQPAVTRIGRLLNAGAGRYGIIGAASVNDADVLSPNRRFVALALKGSHSISGRAVNFVLTSAPTKARGKSGR